VRLHHKCVRKNGSEFGSFCKHNRYFSVEEWHALNDNNGGRLLLCKLHECSRSLYGLLWAFSL